MPERAAEAPLPAGGREGSCITHHGELLQGGLRRHGEVTPFLVSLPGGTGS